MAAGFTGNANVLPLLLLLLSSVTAHEDHSMIKMFPKRVLLNLDPNIKVTISVQTFTVQDQKVDIEVSGVQAPGASDFIAIYSPADVDVTQKWPVYFRPCIDLDPNYLANGGGKASLSLRNHRASFRLSFVKGSIYQASVMAQSAPIWNMIPGAPTGGHLALHADQRSIVVQWVSGLAYPQQVEFTAAAGGATEQVDSVAVTYTAAQLCAEPATTWGWLDPGYIHSAVIPASKLTAGSRYTYRYGNKSVGFSKDYSFLAPVGPGPIINSGGTEQDFKFLMWADVGTTTPTKWNDPSVGGKYAKHIFGENSTHLARTLKAGAEADAHLALHVGDIAYAVGAGANWDAFHVEFEEAYTQWPVAVSPGNHERNQKGTNDALDNTSNDSGGECNVPYMYRFYTPANANLDARTSYYAFSQGPVHFLMLDSESPSGPTTPQGIFVRDALSKVDRTVTPWVIASMHRMMLSPGGSSSGDATGDLENMIRLQSDYEGLFKQYQVDMVLQGHVHVYARTCAVYKRQCTAPVTATQISAPAGGPVYILAGHGGASFHYPFKSTLPDWAATGVQGRNGYLRFTATSKRLTMTALNALNGAIMDKVELVRQ